MRVLGIDPGLAGTGYAVVEKDGNEFSIINSGVLKTEKEPIGERLVFIYNGLINIIEECSPDTLVVESSFFSKNVDSLTKMSEVKGIVILAAAQKHLNVFEYTPAVIKKSIVGRGRATKEQVKYMVEQIIKKSISGSFDVSDAIAIAICHIQRT
jgi:crossover junction endodeoxyribonuclease RuvC